MQEAHTHVRSRTHTLIRMLALISDPEPVGRESDTWPAVASELVTTAACVRKQFNNVFLTPTPNPQDNFTSQFLLCYRSVQLSLFSFT